ncbi:MAG TPA: DUF1467 family protein [Pseudolabrys sp.]|jgi:predicted secreted protein|nr:DUF1467 family protein [Pseudolabrys sp.]
MSRTTLIAIYFIIWWVVLFAVLPWGVRSQEESGEISAGTDPGAPASARMLRKLIFTTLISAVIFGVFYGLQAANIISLEKIIQFASPPHT